MFVIDSISADCRLFAAFVRIRFDANYLVGGAGVDVATTDRRSELMMLDVDETDERVKTERQRESERKGNKQNKMFRNDEGVT